MPDSPQFDLLVTKSATAPLEIVLFDESGVLENMAGADKATFAVKKSTNDTAAVLSKATGGAGLTIDIPNSKLVATLTQPEADAWPIGELIGDVGVRFGVDTAWYFSDRFVVRVVPAIAPKI